MSKKLRKTGVIILAAGKGTRMQSQLPKVLHSVGGLPMVGHVLQTAATIQPEKILLVVGHGAAAVEKASKSINKNCQSVLQEHQYGTGHAVKETQQIISDTKTVFDDIFVLYGDTPLLPPEILTQMQAKRSNGADIVVLGFNAAIPGGYGRLVLGENNTDVEAIVEAKDATPAQLDIKICNSGVMCINGAILYDLVEKIDNKNAKGEYYLTDIIELARRDNKKCQVVICQEDDVLGVNSRKELAHAEAIFQQRRRSTLLESGVTMIDPQTVYLSHDTQIAPDVRIEPNVFFGVNVRVEAGSIIKGFSHLEGCHLGENTIIGPFARLRPGTLLAEGAKVGNFVEIKNADIAAYAKINHLSYIGDATIGTEANIGAGTITCNYDGFSKHKTTIGARAFIGSNSSLVAPVTIGTDSYIGSGSVITNDVSENSLALSRTKQVVKIGRATEIRNRLLQLKQSRLKKGN